MAGTQEPVTSSVLSRICERGQRNWHKPGALVRFRMDCVARHDTEQRARNNRIRLNGGLNQYCAQVFVLESILLLSVEEIVLQHIRMLCCRIGAVATRL